MDIIAVEDTVVDSKVVVVGDIADMVRVVDKALVVDIEQVVDTEQMEDIDMRGVGRAIEVVYFGACTSKAITNLRR